MLPAVTVEGLVRPDGTLEVQQKLTLPAGRVQVTVVPLPELPKDDPFWQMMQGIWDSQKARGHVPRSEAQVEEERRAMRQEWEERTRAIERIQAEARLMREQRT